MKEVKATSLQVALVEWVYKTFPASVVDGIDFYGGASAEYAEMAFDLVDKRVTVTIQVKGENKG